MTDLLLLSRRPRGYTARRLVAAARALGHAARALPPESLQLSVGNTLDVRRRGVRIPPPRAIHLRCGAAELGHAIAVGEALRSRGTRALNRLDVLAALAGPLAALIRLSSSGIPVLPAVTLGEARGVDRAIFDVGGLPVVLRSSAPGKDGGTVVGRTRAGTRAAAQVLLEWKHSVVVQRAVNVSHRCIVVMGGCVAAIQQAPVVAKVTVPASVTSLAEQAAAALSLEVCGVDVAMTADGPMVQAVSTAPALEAAEALLDVDLAREVALAWAAVANGSGTRAQEEGAAL